MGSSAKLGEAMIRTGFFGTNTMVVIDNKIKPPQEISVIDCLGLYVEPRPFGILHVVRVYVEPCRKR